MRKISAGLAITLEDVAGRPLAVVSSSGLFSWGTQNHPEFLLKRNIIAVALAAIIPRPSFSPRGPMRQPNSRKRR